MKKRLFWMVALIGALFTPKTRANDIEPTKEFYTAIHRGGAITIDGNLDDWAGVPVLADPKFAVVSGKEGTAEGKGKGGADGNYVLFEQYGGGTWSGPDDQTSAVQVAWDEDNIYFGFTVTDDYHENSANSAWNGDSIQLMVADATRTQQVGLYNYALGGTEDAIGDLVEANRYEAGPNPINDPSCNCEQEIAIKRDTVKKRTYYEIRLPKASFALTALAAGTKFGLGMAINDGDDGPGQNGQKGWGGLGAHALVFSKSPGETALVTLSSEVPGQDRIFFSAINPAISSFTFRATDKGASIVDAQNAKLTIDNKAVTLTSKKTGDATDFSYTPTQPFASGSKHTYLIEVKDTSGNTVSATGDFTTPAYTTLAASDKVTVDTAKRGFIWRVHQLDSNVPTTNDRTIQQLAGLLGANVADPNAIGAGADFGTPQSPGNAPIQFVIPTVINLSDTDGTTFGNVTPDLPMPGIPGTTGSTDNIAAEILTAVEFPAPGLYHLIVNSDDAFRTTFGKSFQDIFAPVAGEFDAGRGSTDSAFDVYVPEAGIYPMRTIYNDGTGDGNIEILSLVAGAKVLLNDTDTNPQALKTYQISPSAFAAYVRNVSPSPNSRALSVPGKVEASIVDSATTVTQGSVSLKLNGQAVTANTTKNNGVTTITYTPAPPLANSTEYTAELTYSDNNGPRTVTWKFNTGPFGAKLFVIEAEDFDYSEDGVTGGLTNPQKGTTGLDVDVMPYIGGAYEGLSAVEGVDYNNDDGNDSDVYRTELDENGENEVNIASANGIGAGNGLGGTYGVGSNDRVNFTLENNYRIGWVGANNWQNYTRTFPDSGTGGWWKVYAGLSYGDVGEGQLSAALDKVTAGVGTPDQTLERLGSFSAPGSGGWGNNNLVVMKNASGAEAVVKLVGKNTVRFNNTSGDFDFLIFTPGSPPPPFVNAAPQDSVEPNAVVLDWELKDTDAAVAPSSVKVFIEGNDVTSKATVNKTGSATTIHLDLTGTPIAQGVRTWRLTFQDNSTPAANISTEGTFTVVPFEVPGIFYIEAEDFNYSENEVGGKTNPQKGTEGLDVDVMPYMGGAYDTLSAIEGVDYNNGDGNDSDVYRTELDENGENEVNIATSTGRFGTVRGPVEVPNNYRIGWVAPGEWQNYTRTFPDHTYNVWAALSYDGRTAGLLSGSLDLVTSDPSQPNQTTQPLGTFSAPGSGGWGRNEMVPMRDTSGNVATVQLAGPKTVRFNLGSGDFDFLAFVPVSGGTEPGTPTFTSVRRNANGSITVEWTGQATLEVTPSLSQQTWTAVPGATSPYTFTPAANQPTLFGRLKK